MSLIDVKRKIKGSEKERIQVKMFKSAKLYDIVLELSRLTQIYTCICVVERLQI
jgi:hypothetical protein